MDKASLDTLEVCEIFVTNATGNKRLSIKGQTLSLSIYENLFQHLVTCEIAIVDALALAHEMPFIGEEILEVELKSTNADKSIKYKFMLYGMDNGTPHPYNNYQVFILKGSSLEFLSDAAISVQKTYQDTYTSMVGDMVSTYLGSSKKVYATGSKGIHKITFPNINPLKAIEMVRQRATSNDYPYSPFLFYETSSGFWFVDLVSRFKQARGAPLSDITRTYRIANTDDLNEFEGDSWRNIISYVTVNKHDTTNKTHMGAYYSKIQKFDLLTKDYSEVETQLANVGRNFDLVTTGEFNTSGFVNAMSKKGMLNYTTITDSTLNESHVDFFGQKRAYSVLFFQTLIDAEFHADTTLEAGKVLFLDISKVTGLTTDDYTQDKQQSGYYMISNLAYHITMDNEPRMTVACQLVKGANKDISGDR